MPPQDHTAPAPTLSLVAALIPAAEPLVSRHRAHLDRSARLGIPAHVTVLSPFIAPSDIDERVLERLAAAVATVSAFDLTFNQTAWFGEQVVWLAPQPDRPLRDLTAAVAAAFPDHPPYAGAFDDPVPHLTIGEHHLGDAAALHRAEREVTAVLPLHAQVERVHLLTGTDADNSWSALCELALS